jgi:hypothetical protein
VNHDAYINFLVVGVQLLPVLWIALAVETTTLRAAFKAPATRQNRAGRRVLLLRTIPFGAVPEFVALAAQFNDQRVLVQSRRTCWSRPWASTWESPPSVCTEP